MLLITILSQFIISLYKMRDNSSGILPFLSPNLLRSDARAARVRRSVSPDISKLGKKEKKKESHPIGAPTHSTKTVTATVSSR